MSRLAEALREWAIATSDSLPQMCPSCGKLLDTIRYAHNRDRMVVHLTGVTIEDDYYVAECPHCGCELTRKFLGMRRSFWK